MRARALGTLPAATVSLLAATALVVLPAPASAAEPCVGVIVDGRLLGEGVRTGCATGDPDTGLQALTKAGFSYAFVPRQPGLVCQIDGLPDCGRTTTSTYWSYWYREPGSHRWVYSSLGAAQHDPKPGSTEAWVWQDGGRREPPDVALSRICPQVAEQPNASPKPGTASPRATRSSRPTPTATKTPTQSARPTTPTSSPPASDSASVTAAPGPTTATPRPQPAAAERDSGSSPLALVAAVAAIAALLGASRWQRARRRGPEEGR